MENRFQNLPFKCNLQRYIVDVESVRFTDATVGISGTTNLLQLATAGVTVGGTLTATGDLTVGTAGFVVTAANGNTAVPGTLGVTGLLTLAGASLSGDIATSKAAAAITHTGATSLAISSSTGFVSIAGGASGTAQYVLVEDVRFAGADIGIAADPDLLGLADGAATVRGALTATGDLTIGADKLTVVASSGNTAVAGTLGVTSDVTVGASKFTVVASTGNTVVAGTLGVTGAVGLYKLNSVDP